MSNFIISLYIPTDIQNIVVVDVLHTEIGQYRPASFIESEFKRYRRV